MWSTLPVTLKRRRRCRISAGPDPAGGSAARAAPENANRPSTSRAPRPAGQDSEPDFINDYFRLAMSASFKRVYSPLAGLVSLAASAIDFSAMAIAPALSPILARILALWYSR